MERKASTSDNITVKPSIDGDVWEIYSWSPGQGMTEMHGFRAHEADALRQALEIANERIKAMREDIAYMKSGLNFLMDYSDEIDLGEDAGVKE